MGSASPNIPASEIGGELVLDLLGNWHNWLVSAVADQLVRSVTASYAILKASH